MLGVVTGLKAEARCFAKAPDVVAVASGGRAERTAWLTESLVERGAVGLISFGVAGALASSLSRGTIVLPDHVVAANGDRFACDPEWRRALVDHMAQRHQPSLNGTLLGLNHAVTDPADKTWLRRHTGALVVDMESHIVASVAKQHRLPFAAIRAVSDREGDAIPALALRGLAEDGSTRIGPILAGLLRAPTALPALLRLAVGQATALAALRRAAASVSGSTPLGRLV